MVVASWLERGGLYVVANIRCVFFFQAEDGIRDVAVTGVQTCALPIWSARAERPFVDINCGAVQEALFESEFFGHERGSFTGAAAQKTGLVEAADGGTLFLDEVSEMPLSTQVKLLRFLETGQFRRVGGVRALNADVRLVAASNRDLEAITADGRFRQDLYFRLAVFRVEVPSLRDRPADVPVLAEHFVRHFNARTGRRVGGFDAESLDALGAYPWPGNVRELRNAIERA